MSKKSYYDAVFQDVEGSKLYLEWISKYLKSSSTVLEMACGTGDLAKMLSESYMVDAFDIDKNVIQKAKEKYPDLKDRFFVADFLDLSLDKNYDALVCINDSLNYILNEEDLDRFVAITSKLSDEIFLDSHHPFRLEEFSEPYLEEGRTNEFDYSYQISTDGDFLVHIINFLDGNYDSVFQWVFDPMLLKEKYEALAYKVDLYTDFQDKGINQEGEKIMYHIYREDKE